MLRKVTVVLLFLLPLACATTTKRERTGTVYEIIVDKIFPNSPAAKGGLKAGDKILKVGGEAIFSHKDFHDALARIPVGEWSTFAVLRDNSKINIDIIPGKGRYRFGFGFKTRDPEITRQLKFKIWPEEINPAFKKFTILFHLASLRNKNSRSPQQKVLHRIREILVNKGYAFTENYESADFIVETEYKSPKTSSDTETERKRKLPFDAFRVVFLDKKDNKPFLKVSGVLDEKKSIVYGVKGYVYAMLDAMIEKFPSYRDRNSSATKYAASEKKAGK